MNARRMALSGVSSLCAMVVVLLVACVPALAAEEHPYIPTDSVIGQVGEGQADGLATHSHGDIYITNHNKDEIQIYDLKPKKITDFKTPSETGNGPTSLAVDSEGAVYVDYFKHGVYKYRPTAFPPTASTTYALEESAGNKGVIVEKEGGAYADRRRPRKPAPVCRRGLAHRLLRTQRETDLGDHRRRPRPRSRLLRPGRIRHQQ